MKWLIPILILLLLGCTAAPTFTPNGNTKEFELTAHDFAFEPALISVDAGDHVVLHITSADSEHGISIPGFDVSAKLPENQVTTVEFDATKQGLFEFRCNVFCGSGHDAMAGAIEVN
jgi:cytochrome c oxidase subunit 2